MICTLAEVRAAISTSLPDDSLRDLMEAAESDITGAVGATTTATEYGEGGYAALVLRRPIGTITSVTEYADTTSATVIAADDYRVDGHLLHRLATGTNPYSTWRGLVKVVHAPPDRLPEMKRAQVALIRLDLTSAAGVTAESIGDYSVSYGMVKGPTYAEQRTAILATLSPVMAA